MQLVEVKGEQAGNPTKGGREDMPPVAATVAGEPTTTEPAPQAEWELKAELVGMEERAARAVRLVREGQLRAAPSTTQAH